MSSKNILLVAATVILVIISFLSYQLYDLYFNQYGYHLSLTKEEKPIDDIGNKISNPTGSALPIDMANSKPLPVVTDPSGIQIPLSSPKAGQPDKNNNNNDQPGSDFSDTANWKTYTNKKYHYSFKYPQEYDYSPCDEKNPCKYGQVYEKDGGDETWLNGATKSQGWPYINIMHYDNESYTLPEKTKFYDWLQQKLGWSKDNAPKDFNHSIATEKGDPKKAMRVNIPQTPQAYARDEIYFEVNGKIFQIQLSDSNKVPAQEFYSLWLKTFRME